MKRSIKIWLFVLIACLVTAISFAACSGDTDKDNGDNGGDNTGNPGGGSSQVVTEPDRIDVDAGSYDVVYGPAYGAVPDLDVLVDGNLDEEIWTSADRKWYTQLEPTQRIRIDVTTAFSDKGLYIAARSKDSTIAWQGQNYFFKNTNFQFNIYEGNRPSFSIDANNIKPSRFYVNARSRYQGELNYTGLGEGLSIELFVEWSMLEIDVSAGLPESITMMPIYNYCTRATVANTYQILPTFVRSSSNSLQALEFDGSGYVDGDHPDARIGSHKDGLGKTAGWTVENVGAEDERVSSDGRTTVNYPQAIFFRDVMSSRFKITTKIAVTDIVTDARVGIMFYRDAINYRAVALNLNSVDYVNKKVKNYNLRGYTNYPSNITTATDFVSMPAKSDGEIELTVYNNTGNLYYILNDEYVYSETASYAALNMFAGFYSYNANATFYDYGYETFDSENEFIADLAQYAYTVSVSNKQKSQLEVSTDQIAVKSGGNGSVIVTMTFAEGYTLGRLYYKKSNDDTEYDLVPDYASKASGGVFTLNNLDSDIIIYSEPAADTREKITLNLTARDSQTKELINGLRGAIIGTGPYSRYNVQFRKGELVIAVPVGESWSYEVSSSNYVPTTGSLYDGAVVNEDKPDSEPVYANIMLVGGLAEAALGADGQPVTNFSISSNLAETWDIGDVANTHAVFQTTKTANGVVYFSGRTISDYQVAYVEITNRTDPSAFTSLENDPAAGFIISGPTTNSYIGLHKDGLRILTDRDVWSTFRDVYLPSMRYPGHLADVQRDNGGLFNHAYLGYGSIDRIPYDGQEYTTSLMIIRKGGYVHVYAYDGKAGVLSDKTNFSKMSHVYSYYEASNTGYAAIGFGVTVNYNLRVDFNNFWILAEDAAAEFANDHIADKLSVSGSEKLTLTGDSIIKMPSEGGHGLMVKGGDITLSANDLEKGNMLKVECSDGQNFYLTGNGQKITCTPKTPGEFSLHATEVSYVTVRGTVQLPSGLQANSVTGYLINALGERISSFKPDVNGGFSMAIESGADVFVEFSANGYITDKIPVSSDSDSRLDGIELKKISIGGNLMRVDGVYASSISGIEYSQSESDGLSMRYVDADGVLDGPYINEEYNNRDSIEISFSYKFAEVPAGVTVDGDPSIGVTFYGTGGHCAVRFIGDGYRICPQESMALVVGGRGIGTVNLQEMPNYEAYEFKIVKFGSIVYMYSKLESEKEYTFIKAYDMLKDIGSTEATAKIVMCYYQSYCDVTLSNIKVSIPDRSDYPELVLSATSTSTDGGQVLLSNSENLFAGDKIEARAVADHGYKLVSFTADGVNLLPKNFEGTEYTAAYTVMTDVVFEAQFEEIRKVTTKTVTFSHAVKCKGIIAVRQSDNAEIIFGVTKYESNLTETVAYVDEAGKQIKLYLPVGTWTVTLCSDAGCVSELGSYEITVE